MAASTFQADSDLRLGSRSIRAMGEGSNTAAKAIRKIE
jgi:hypothetical protein